MAISDQAFVVRDLTMEVEILGDTGMEADAATAGTWKPILHVGDGTGEGDDPDKAEASIGVRMMVDGAAVNGGMAYFSKDAFAADTPIYQPLCDVYVPEGAVLSIKLLSNNAADDAVKVAVTMQRVADVPNTGIPIVCPAIPALPAVVVSGTSNPAGMAGVWVCEGTFNGHLYYIRNTPIWGSAYLWYYTYTYPPKWTITANAPAEGSLPENRWDNISIYTPTGSYTPVGTCTGTLIVTGLPIDLDSIKTSVDASVAGEKIASIGMDRDRVKASIPPTHGAIGEQCFLFDLVIESVDEKIISGESEIIEQTQEDDRIKITTEYTEALIGTQWQATINVLQHDLAYTELIGDPVVAFSSSDESVATVDVAGQVHYINDGTCRIVAISKAIGTSPSQRDEWEITNSTSGGQTTTRITYIDDVGSCRENATAAVDERIAVEGKEKEIFSTQDHTTPIYVRNANCWAADLNLTCISPWNSTGAGTRAGTLISPQHILFANHYPIAVGATIRFVDGSNNIVTRTIMARQRIGTTDLMVGVLDSDVTGCTFAKILPVDWVDYIPGDGIQIPTLALNQQKKALVTDVSNLDNPTVFHATFFAVPTDETRLAFYESLISGDSGNPAFLIINNELVLLTVWTGGGPGTGYGVAAYRVEIEAAMQTLGGGYGTLTEIDLSGFNTYE